MRPLRTKPIFTPPTKRPLKPLFVSGVIAVAVTGAVLLGIFYRTHALPNVGLASADVGSKTLQELEQIAKSQFQKLSFQFISPTKKITVTAGELGITLDAAKTAEQAYNLRRNLVDGLQLWRPLNTPLVVQYDRAKIIQFLQQTFGNEYILPTDATLQFNENLQIFQVVEGRLGKGFDIHEITDMIQRQAWQPQQATIHTHTVIEPEYTAASVAKTGDDANEIARLNFSFLYQNKVMYIAEPNEIAAWLRFKSAREPGRLIIWYDRQAIADFLEQKVTKSLNDFYGPEGSIPAQDPTVRPAKQSLRLQAVDDLINDIIAAATKKTDIEKELKVVE